MNVNDIVSKIKTVGQDKVRIVPMENQSVFGNQQIDVYDGSNWKPIITGLQKTMAEDLVRQAFNRVILG